MSETTVEVDTTFFSWTDMFIHMISHCEIKKVKIELKHPLVPWMKQWYSSWALKKISWTTLAIMAKVNASPIKGHLGIALSNKSGMGNGMFSP